METYLQNGTVSEVEYILEGGSPLGIQFDERGEGQSGTFKGRKNKLPKRGSPQVRAVLHMAAVSSVSRNRDGTYRNPVLPEYYERKCAEKPCKVAQGAVMRKLSNIIYAVLRDRRPFELRTPQEHMALLTAA